MYKLSNNKRKYSPTPLVKVEDGKETHVLYSALPKKEGEEMLQNIANILNK